MSSTGKRYVALRGIECPLRQHLLASGCHLQNIWSISRFAFSPLTTCFSESPDWLFITEDARRLLIICLARKVCKAAVPLPRVRCSSLVIRLWVIRVPGGGRLRAALLYFLPEVQAAGCSAYDTFNDLTIRI